MTNGFHCCGKHCSTFLPISIYSTLIISNNGGFIFCSEACADDPQGNPFDIITRQCIYVHTKEIEIMSELAE